MDQKIEAVQLVADPYPPYQYIKGETVKVVDHDTPMIHQPPENNDSNLISSCGLMVLL
jgi:hypothetical protein